LIVSGKSPASSARSSTAASVYAWIIVAAFGFDIVYMLTRFRGA
jgi:hypothetical protein